MRAVLPPGTILQLMYLEERVDPLPAGTFVEVGTGHGHVSATLLDRGWRGAAYELNAGAVEVAERRCVRHIEAGRFSVRHADWLDTQPEQGSVDLVVSSMVLEHLDSADERRYFDRAREWLRPGGRGILLVPGSPDDWGIEDEIAGHMRRYTVASLTESAQRAGWRVEHIAGLTYPLSNLLLGLSNARVRRAESRKAELTLAERTRRSGDRDVRWKTSYPKAAVVLLNRITMRPFFMLQRKAAHNPRSMVIYCECRPD